MLFFKPSWVTSCLPAFLVSFRHHGSGAVIDELIRCSWFLDCPRSHNKSTSKILEVCTYQSYHHLQYPLVLFFLTNCWFWFLAEGYDFILNSESVRKAQKHLNSYLKFPVPPHIMRSLSLLNRSTTPFWTDAAQVLRLEVFIPIPLTWTWDGPPLQTQLKQLHSGDLRWPHQSVSAGWEASYIKSYYNDLQVWLPR